MNPYDRVAVEAALRQKEKLGGKVAVMSMGPPWAKEALVECLAMGADEAVLLSDRVFAGADTLATAHALADTIKKFYPHIDLILCGRKAIDAETGQVGPQVAELLEMPHVCYANRLDINPESRRATVQRETDYGYDVVEVSLPFLVTVNKNLAEPRLPTLQRSISARRKGVKSVNAIELGGNVKRYGLKGSPTIVSKVFPPQPRGKGEILRGDPETVARKLVEALIRSGALGVGRSD